MIEMVLVAALMIVVLGATLSVIDVSWSNTKRTQAFNDAEDTARFGLDLLAKQLRNLAVPTPQSKSIDSAGSYDLIFKTADPNFRRVRYCLSNGNVYYETQSVPSGTSSDPPLPATGTCPGGTAGGWSSSQVLIQHVTNQVNGQNRPIFFYNSDPSGDTAKITEIRALLYVDMDPAHRPAETSVATGVYLRNQNQAPSASFGWKWLGVGHFLLDGSGSSDPEGRTLRYYWLFGAPSSSQIQSQVSSGQCTLPSCAGQGVTLDYTITSGNSQQFTLVVADPGGLYATLTRTCSFSASPPTGACS